MGVRKLLAASILLAGCTPTGEDPYMRPLGIPGATPPPQPSPTAAPTRPPAPTPVPTTSPTGRVVYGLANLRTVSNPYFQENSAYGLLGVTLGGAFVTVSTLENGLVSFGGSVVSATTDGDGRFKLDNVLAPDFAGVASVALAGGHRVSALIQPSSRDLTIDEASSMVVELARWQATPAAVAAWPPAAVQALYDKTLSLVKAGDLPADGSPPVVEALQAGAGFKLRNRYAVLMGAALTRANTTDADVLSDTWRGLLGYRPLGVTVAAGGGPDGEDAPAPHAALAGPTDAVPDAAGNVWIVDHDAHLIRVVAGADRPAWLGRSPNLTAGRLYTLLGTDDGPKSAAAFEALYAPLEAAAAANPEAAPPVLNPGFPLFAPRRLLLEPGDTDVPGIFLSSDEANRVFWIPAKDAVRFGRRVRAGRLYTLAPATRPTALALDPVGDVITLDAMGLRVVRATDGQAVPLVLQANGASLVLQDALDMKLVGRTLYVADTRRHVVWKAALPADDRALQAAAPTLAAEAVVGQPDKPGLGPVASTLYAANDGLAGKDALLNLPDGLALAADGQLVVSDGGNQRLRLVDASGKVYSIGGAFQAPDVDLEGDARLAAFPGTSSLAFDANGDLLLADRRAHVVRRLHSRRGIR